MANTYLVPIDFSRASERALDFALKMAREKEGKSGCAPCRAGRADPSADWQSA